RPGAIYTILSRSTAAGIRAAPQSARQDSRCLQTFRSHARIGQRSPAQTQNSRPAETDFSPACAADVLLHALVFVPPHCRCAKGAKDSRTSAPPRCTPAALHQSAKETKSPFPSGTRAHTSRRPTQSPQAPLPFAGSLVHVRATAQRARGRKFN